MVTGYSRLDPVDLMKSIALSQNSLLLNSPLAIGFKNVHSIDEYASCHPELNPLCSYETPKHRLSRCLSKIEILDLENGQMTLSK